MFGLHDPTVMKRIWITTLYGVDRWEDEDLILLGSVKWILIGFVWFKRQLDMPVILGPHLKYMYNACVLTLLVRIC